MLSPVESASACPGWPTIPVTEMPPSSSATGIRSPAHTCAPRSAMLLARAKFSTSSPSDINRYRTSNRPKLDCISQVRIRASSARGDFRNFLRAGVLKNRCSTSISVPSFQAQLCTSMSFPPLNVIEVPTSASRLLVISLTLETAAIEASASPRNPSVARLSRSSIAETFEVACRSNARMASSRVIPQPSSRTRMRL